MSYMALYRKWRPENFDEVKGQDAIVQALRNQVIYDRIGHASLFCGTRGTGKTTIARIFARAVNCEHPINGNPCGQCPSCQAIQAQNSLNIHEIDGASNNGVEQIRTLREEVQYLPPIGRYRVYIIDEVHMLSHSAFNALLKTLEEPPSHILFILATTERHKVPATILSRCQKYDFKRISGKTITDHLTALTEREGVRVTQKALEYIARTADGSMRDALSLLDQCISYYVDETLTYDHVLAVLGTVDLSVFRQLLAHILAQDNAALLADIDQAVLEGRELSRYLSDFIWYLRNLLILKDQAGSEESVNLSEESIQALKEEALRISTPVLIRYIRVLSDLSNQLKSSSQKRILMEVGFLRLANPWMETDKESLFDRFRLLEEKVAETTLRIPAAGPRDANAVSPAAAPMNANPVSPTAAPMNGNSVSPTAATVEGFADGGGRRAGSTGPAGPGREGPGISDDPAELDKRFPPAEADDLKRIASGWKEIIAATDLPVMRGWLQAARPVVSEDSSSIQLMFEEEGIQKDYFERNHHENLDALSHIIAKVTGKQVSLTCITRRQAASVKAGYIDLSKLQEKIHLPIIEE